MVWREINEHLDSAHPTIASETSIAYAKSAAQQAFYPHHDVYRQSRTRRRPQMASNRRLDHISRRASLSHPRSQKCCEIRAQLALDTRCGSASYRDRQIWWERWDGVDWTPCLCWAVRGGKHIPQGSQLRQCVGVYEIQEERERDRKVMGSGCNVHGQKERSWANGRGKGLLCSMQGSC